MKKSASLIILAFLGGAAAAQDLIAEPQKTNTYPISNDHGQTPGVFSASQGDTLFYFEGYNFFVSNPADAAVFSYLNTGNNPNPVASAFSNTPFAVNPSFVFFYSIHNGDTLNYIGATSWFSPIHRADNWFCFGPVTVPLSGATLHWQHAMPNNSYRDGYKVRVSTSGLQPYTDFSLSSAVYSVNDQSVYTSGDSVLSAFETLELDPVYNGQQVYIAFHHDANDKFILYLDEIMLTEGVTGMQEGSANNVSISGNRPNPAIDETYIHYSLNSPGPVSVIVYDIAGKEIMRLSEGNKSKGAHTVKIDVSQLPAGIYYYTVNAGEYKAAKRMIVSR
jgi:hypothetical protein